MVLLELVSHVSCWRSLPHQRLENAHYRHSGSWTSRATRLVVSVKFNIEDPKNSWRGEGVCVFLLFPCYQNVNGPVPLFPETPGGGGGGS